MRLSALLTAIAALAACTGGTGEAPQAAEASDRIDCAPAGAEVFGADCTFELAERDGENLIVVHNPDGSFHRFRIVDDGRGLEVADGAQPIALAYADGKMTVAIGGDRYVLPAIEREIHAAE
ncbi:hypothetical protein GRI89_08165 [Altererythrobacter salegens]|uniref:Lipoprotein n=1 Tax=Croceibacterium salegens TaxID=1737568 RepID=A0A6I4STZ0_9SPHN|nr:hypothetical protein [Croceibacterium salegens]MXO59514.1 hypothetical protein [Croceibacterium salegens]